MAEADDGAHEAIRSANEYFEAGQYETACRLYERIFDGQNAEIAARIGYIYDRQESGLYDVDQATYYYRIAAANGDSYAQHWLGGTYVEKGDIPQALEWYAKASLAGNAECSFNMYVLLRREDRIEEALRSLKLAASQGHAQASQIYSLNCLFGKYGASQIAPGLFRYFANIPALIRYAKEAGR